MSGKNFCIDIEKIGADGLRFDELVRVPASDESDGVERVEVLRARLRGFARPSRGGIECDARLDGAVRLECSRCLERFETGVGTDFSLTIVADAVEFGAEEARMAKGDASLFYATGGKADLGMMAAEQIYLNLPLKPICSEGCRGLCPTCGENRNRIECDCRSEQVDPRLVPLLKVKDRLDGA